MGKNVFNYVDYKLLNLKNASNFQFQVRIIQIVFASAFSSCILHTKFPIHHIFSMIIVCIGLLLVNFANIVNLSKNSDFERFYYVLILLITLVFFGIQEVLHKKIMQSNYVSPYKLLFLEGSISLILQVILLIIIAITGLFEETPFYENCEPLHILIFFFFFLSEAFLNLFVLLTNFYYSPTHRSVSDSLACLILTIIFLFMEGGTDYSANIWYIITLIIGMPLLLFGCLLYNELIIVYVWGLNSNTSKEVIKRANEEQSQFESIEAKLIVKDVEQRTSKLGNVDEY